MVGPTTPARMSTAKIDVRLTISFVALRHKPTNKEPDISGATRFFCDGRARGAITKDVEEVARNTRVLGVNLCE
jgi:hypothetical protein